MFKRILTLFFINALVLFGVSVFAKADTNERLQQAVMANGIVLNTDQRLNLINNCKDAQILLQNLQQTTDSLIEERVIIYTTIQQELQAIKLRMNRQGADASETDLLTGKIQQGLEEFNNLAANYKLALADVIEVNCTTYPEHFQAGLIVMRIKRAALLDQLSQMQSTVCDPAPFEQLKNRLVI